MRRKSRPFLTRADGFRRPPTEAAGGTVGVPTSVVYFLGTETRTKIGTTRDLPRRLAALQIGSPERLEVAAIIAGDELLEVELHGLFASRRLHGEWFALPRTEAVAFARHRFPGCVTPCDDPGRVFEELADELEREGSSEEALWARYLAAFRRNEPIDDHPELLELHLSIGGEAP